MIRRDKIGRRIGYNWWRELIMSTWRSAYDAWCAAAEEASVGYATELAAWKLDNPTPTLKATMIGLAR